MHISVYRDLGGRQCSGTNTAATPCKHDGVETGWGSGVSFREGPPPMLAGRVEGPRMYTHWLPRKAGQQGPSTVHSTSARPSGARLQVVPGALEPSVSAPPPPAWPRRHWLRVRFLREQPGLRRGPVGGDYMKKLGSPLSITLHNSDPTGFPAFSCSPPLHTACWPDWLLYPQ